MFDGETTKGNVTLNIKFLPQKLFQESFHGFQSDEMDLSNDVTETSSEFMSAKEKK